MKTKKRIRKLERATLRIRKEVGILNTQLLLLRSVSDHAAGYHEGEPCGLAALCQDAVWEGDNADAK